MRTWLSGLTLAVLFAGCGSPESVTGPTADATHDPAADASSTIDASLPGQTAVTRALSVGAGMAPNSSSLPRGTWRVQPADIVDGQGFERPLVAYRVLVPVGWRAEGGVVWNVQNPCAGSDYAVRWSITAPDGVSVLAFVPQPKWQIVRSYLPIPMTRGPCEGPGWTNVQQYLEGLARQTFPQGRILDFRARPDLARPIVEMLRQLPAMQSDLLQARQRAEAGEIMVATNVDGRETRDVIRAVVMFNETRMMDIMNPGRVGQETLDAVPLSVAFMRGPADGFDLRLADLVERSMLQMSEWNNRVFEHNRRKQQAAFEAAIRAGNISQQQLQAMNQAHQARMQALDANRQVNDRLYDQRSLSSDRQQREFVEAIRGVETYHEPVAGGVVQLDNTYQHAWRVRDGSYLLTDDPDFRPGLIGLEGQALRRVE